MEEASLMSSSGQREKKLNLLLDINGYNVSVNQLINKILASHYNLSPQIWFHMPGGDGWTGN